MGYLVLGLIIGVVANRYIMPILDMFLELLNYWITKICTSIQIDTNIMSVDYQEIADQGNQLTPTIGFLGGNRIEDEDFYDDEEDGEENKSNKIGFIK
jgi:hypothetical protein